jgi:hypothetical protein
MKKARRRGKSPAGSADSIPHRRQIMNSVSRTAIPTNSDGLIVPALIPVAAFLCVEGYHDGARSRLLERLADGVPPRKCVEDGALEPADLAEVDRLLADCFIPAPAEAEDLADHARWSGRLDAFGRHDARPAPAPISGGAPEADDFPRTKTAADRRRDMDEIREWYRTHPDAD